MKSHRPFKIFSVLMATLFLSSMAAAEPSGVYVTEGLLGYSINFNNAPTSVSQRTMLSSETGLGYIIGGWFYLGGAFNYTSVTEQTTDGANNETNHQETYEYYGPAFGWMGDSWSVIGSYYVNAEKRDVITASGSATQNVDNTGTGFAVNVAYRFPIGSFEVAPQLSFKSINYTNCKDPYSGATSTCNPSIQQTEVTPYVTLLFNFK